jgi:ACS family hexuronate transporter-like MFS transporter
MNQQKPSKLRWAILALLFTSTVLNYLDRQALSILTVEIQKDMHMSTMEYAKVVQVFLVTYTISLLGAGWITDKLGTKVSLALFVGWWSIANMLTGLVQSVVQLGITRALLGLGEGGNYTAAPKAVSEHFEPKERGFAVGVYTAGAMLGATIAPPLIVWLASTYNWRSAFFITGAAGLLWLIAWLAIYKTPEASSDSTTKSAPLPLKIILQDRSVWLLACARMLADPVWYFYLFWFPKYLEESHGMSLLQIAQIAWIVYLAADIGSLSGGIFSGYLVKRGMKPQKSRLVVITIAALFAPLGMLIATGLETHHMLALAAMVAFLHLMFMVNITTLIVDKYPTHAVGTIFGIIAAGSSIGGILSTQVVGYFATANQYQMLFILMGLLHPLACGFTWLSSRQKNHLV